MFAIRSQGRKTTSIDAEETKWEVKMSAMTFCIITFNTITLTINIELNSTKHKGNVYDIQHNDFQHDNIQHDDIQHNDIQHNDIQHSDFQHSDFQLNDT